MFESHYESKSGNLWANRKNFKKVASKMYPMDLDYGQDNAELKKIDVAESRLKKILFVTIFWYQTHGPSF